MVDGADSAEYFGRLLSGLARHHGLRHDHAVEKLPAKARKAILEGSTEQVHVKYKNRYGRTRSYYAEFEGVMPFLHRRLEQTESEQMKERYDGYMRDVPVPRVQRRPPAAGDPLRHDRVSDVRQEVDRPGLRSCRSRTAPPS